MISHGHQIAIWALRRQNGLPRKTRNFSRFIYLDINQRERSTRFVSKSRMFDRRVCDAQHPRRLRPKRPFASSWLTLCGVVSVSSRIQASRACTSPDHQIRPKKAQSLHLAATILYIYICIYVCAQSYKNVSEFCIQMASLSLSRRVDQDLAESMVRCLASMLYAHVLPSIYNKLLEFCLGKQENPPWWIRLTYMRTGLCPLGSIFPWPIWRRNANSHCTIRFGCALDLEEDWCQCGSYPWHNMNI